MKYFITLLISLGFISSSFSIPAKRNTLIKYIQPTGDTLNLLLAGDEFRKLRLTTDSILVTKSENGDYYYSMVDTINNEIICSPYLAANPNKRTDEESEFAISQKKAISTFFSENSRSKQNQLKVKNPISSKTVEATTRSSSAEYSDSRYLVLLVEFSDKSFKSSHTKEIFRQMFNKKGFDYQGASGSVSEYFEDQSSGVFTPQYDIVGPLKLSNTMSYYGKNDRLGYDVRPERMVADACNLAAGEIDFSLYDNDNDGLLDFVYIIYAGYGEAQSANEDEIWPHASNIEHFNIVFNNTLIGDYACSSELSGGSGSNLDGIGTVCHELSHILGLPDFYDTEYGGNFGLSYWDIMDSGCYLNNGRTPCSYSAYERTFLGWLDPIKLENPAHIALRDLQEYNEAAILYSDISSSEYFIFENRQLYGWDAYLPASGMLITRINYNKYKWDQNIVNNTLGKQNVQIMPADNELLDYEWNGFKDNWSEFYNSLICDTYPGKTENRPFTDSSSPKSEFLSGYVIDRPVTEITETNGVITFNFRNFNNIYNAGTSLSNRDIDEIKIYCSEGTIFIENNDNLPVYIYSSVGQLLQSISNEKDIRIKAEKGIYYVKADKTYKIINF